MFLPHVIHPWRMVGVALDPDQPLVQTQQPFLGPPLHCFIQPSSRGYVSREPLPFFRYAESYRVLLRPTDEAAVTTASFFSLPPEVVRECPVGHPVTTLSGTFIAERNLITPTAIEVLLSLQLAGTITGDEMEAWLTETEIRAIVADALGTLDPQAGITAGEATTLINAALTGQEHRGFIRTEAQGVATTILNAHARLPNVHHTPPTVPDTPSGITEQRLTEAIAAHTNISTAHHTPPATNQLAPITEVERLISVHGSVRTAHHPEVDLSGLQTADDVASAITTHSGEPNVHHTPPDISGLLAQPAVQQLISAAIAQHAALANVHHTPPTGGGGNGTPPPLPREFSLLAGWSEDQTVTASELRDAGTHTTPTSTVTLPDNSDGTNISYLVLAVPVGISITRLIQTGQPRANPLLLTQQPDTLTISDTEHTVYISTGQQFSHNVGGIEYDLTTEASDDALSTTAYYVGISGSQGRAGWFNRREVALDEVQTYQFPDSVDDFDGSFGDTATRLRLNLANMAFLVPEGHSVTVTMFGERVQMLRDTAQDEMFEFGGQQWELWLTTQQWRITSTGDDTAAILGNTITYTVSADA